MIIKKLNNKFRKAKKEVFLFNDIFKEQVFKKGINLGAGRNWQKFNWIGIDKLDGNFLNEKSKLPFKENSIKFIYSSHFFEHISDDCAKNLFKEIKRVLRADGLLRIVVPNFELLHQSLIHEDRTLMDSIGFRGRPEWKNFDLENNNINFVLHWFANYTNYPEETLFDKEPRDFFRGPPKLERKEVLEAAKNLSTIDFGKWAVSKIDKRFINNGGHINTWTTDKLTRCLNQVGIKSRKMDYGKSLSKVLGSFDYEKDRSKISICHEGWIKNDH